MKSFIIKSAELKMLVTICAVVCFSCAIAVAQEVGENKEKAENLTDLELRMQKKVCIDVSDVPIEMVIRQLAEQVDVDFIKSPKVMGNVTVTLTDVSVKEALQSILQVHGCDYIEGENVIRILSQEELPQVSERLVTETFEIIYADVTEVVKALEKFKSPQGSVSSIQGTSHIIVTDTENKVREIDKLIKKIDCITPQILVEVRIYDITSKDRLDLGVEWNAGRYTTYTGTDVGVNPTDKTAPFITNVFEGPETKSAENTTGFLRFGVLDESVDIDMKLTAQKDIVNAKLLANPRILVLDNEQALFDIVTEHPYIERTITGGTVTETVKFKKVGVKLEVTPQVARDGMLRLHIMPEFGVLLERVTLATSNVPVVDTRKVDTIALIKDGQTVALGGLRKKDTVQQISKVPLLSEIPLLGVLFKFEGEKTIDSELVVFITPRIITEPTLSQQEQQAFEVTEFRGPKPATTRAETAKK